MKTEENTNIDSFTKLLAWRSGHKLVLAVLVMCERLASYDPLRNQMERAALSITSNIAEGFGRQTIADKKHFYVMARGSTYELQNQLLVARDMHRIQESELKRVADISLDSIRLLHGLIRSTGKLKRASS